MRTPGARYHETKYCEAELPGGRVCGELTREGKPFCSDHVEEHPYIQKLIAQIHDKQEEEAYVAKHGEIAVPYDSLTVNELLNHLKIYGGRTVERLARELIIDSDIIKYYAEFLAKKEGGRRVRLTKNNRGKITVSLPKPRSLRRRNPDEFLPAPLSRVELVRQEISEHLPSDSFLPSAPLAAEIHPDEPLIPRATFDLMISGDFPLIRAAAGKSWLIKPDVIRSLSRLMTHRGLADVNRWYDLLATCGVSGKLFVMDYNGERYRVIDVEIDPGDETGELILQHYGRRSRGGQRIRVDVHDAYKKIIPFVVYRDR